MAAALSSVVGVAEVVVHVDWVRTCDDAASGFLPRFASVAVLAWAPIGAVLGFAVAALLVVAVTLVSAYAEAVVLCFCVAAVVVVDLEPALFSAEAAVALVFVVVDSE